MFTFTCANCLQRLFAVDSISPCRAPTPLPDLAVGDCRIVNKANSLKLVKSLRCQCGKDVGLWVVSSDTDDYDTWIMSGIWSTPDMIVQHSTREKLHETAQSNSDLRKRLRERTDRIRVLVEGIAVQFIEFAKKMITKIAGTDPQLAPLGVGSLHVIQEIELRVNTLLDEVRLKVQQKALLSKKSVKTN